MKNTESPVEGLLDGISLVNTRGEDPYGFILHEGYQEPAEEPENLHSFVAFCRKDRRSILSIKQRDHLIPVGRTHAANYAEAISVILSHPPTRRKLTTYGVEKIVVRSTLDPLLRVTLDVPPWAFDGGGR